MLIASDLCFNAFDRILLVIVMFIIFSLLRKFLTTRSFPRLYPFQGRPSFLFYLFLLFSENSHFCSFGKLFHFRNFFVTPGIALVPEISFFRDRGQCPNHLYFLMVTLNFYYTVLFCWNFDFSVSKSAVFAVSLCLLFRDCLCSEITAIFRDYQ